VSVCVSARIFLEPHGWSLPNFLCMLPTSMARSSFGRVMKSQGENAIWGFSSPLTMHCNAFAAKGISLSARKGWWECSARAKSDLRLPSCHALKPYGATSWKASLSLGIAVCSSCSSSCSNSISCCSSRSWWKVLSCISLTVSVSFNWILKKTNDAFR